MELWGFIFIVVFGCLGHFIFEWSGHHKWAGLFFAVNESTWEHMKLTILPAMVWLAIEWAIRGFSTNLLVAQAVAMVTMMALIPGTFYGYTAFTKKNWLIIDILCFVVSVAGGMYLYSLILKAAPCCTALAVVAALVILASVAAMLLLSYHPIRAFLWRDPISGNFGPKGHECHAHFHNI